MTELAPRLLFFQGAPALIPLPPSAAQDPVVGWLFLIGVFLIIAMAIGDGPFSRHDRERRRLEKFLRRNDPDAEIFFTEKGQEEKLKEYGWERVPFTWRGLEIWILRKHKPD